MTEKGADKVLSGKLKLGADASAVAGPSGANAAAFNDPDIDILSYSQSKGLFAGASLGSASMGSDNDANNEALRQERGCHAVLPRTTCECRWHIAHGSEHWPSLSRPRFLALLQAEEQGA